MPATLWRRSWRICISTWVKDRASTHSADGSRCSCPIWAIAREGASARWPALAPAALAAGAGALFAFPLQLGAAQLGVLLLYCDRAATLDAAQQARALRLADAAFDALLDLLGGSATASGDGDLDGYGMGEDGGFRRAQVYQAAGMVMAQLGVSIEEATVRLHAYAFANDRAARGRGPRHRRAHVASGRR